MKNGKSTIDVTIIIVSWNVKELLLEAIASVKRFTQNISYEIVVVDNASEDDSVKAVRKNFPEVTVIANEENKGFGTANNQGVRVANGERLIFLNPDTEITYNIIPRLIKSKKETGAMLIGPEQMNGRGKVGNKIEKCNPWLWVLVCTENLLSRFRNSKNPIIFRRIFKVPNINGAFWLIDKKDFEDIGMFDEDIFMYAEEFDVCTRIIRSSGKIFLDRNEHFIHYKGQSVKQVPVQESFHRAYSGIAILKKLTKLRKRNTLDITENE